MKNLNLKRVFLFAVLPPFMLGGAGAIWYQSQNNSAAAYVTEKVERGDIEDSVSALGTVQPLRYVDVGTQVTGQLKTLYVDTGDRVKKGDLIAEIDPIVFASKEKMTEAALKSVQAQLHEKLAQHRFVQQQYERNKGLYASQAVSEELLEQSKATAEQVAAQIESLKAQAELYQAQLDGDQANLRYTKIFAPMSGTVVSLYARVGQTLVATQQAPILLRVADLSTMTVWTQVSEADVPRIALHKPVSFTPIGLPDERWHSEVRQILPTPDTVNNVVLYNVLFDVPNTKMALMPQMSAQTTFVLARSKNTLLVPVSALQAAPERAADDRKPGAKPAGFKIEKKGEQGKKAGDAPADKAEPAQQRKQYTVQVLTPDGKVKERQVTVGVMSRTKAEIISGLFEGEEVIVGTPDGSSKKKKSKSDSEKS